MINFINTGSVENFDLDIINDLINLLKSRIDKIKNSSVEINKEENAIFISNVKILVMLLNHKIKVLGLTNDSEDSDDILGSILEL